MSHYFKELSPGQLHSAIADLLCPKIEAIMNDRGPGHCMRVSDLGDDVLESVCAALRKNIPDGQVFILGTHENSDFPFRITSTKLIELRNPAAHGILRPPLLVFIPASLRTSAEDSFGIATFEDLTFTSVYSELIQLSLARVPISLAGHVRDLFALLSEEKWSFGDDMARVRFLLTALVNGIDGETLGASLYELTLIPDFSLCKDPSSVIGRIRRNLHCVRELMGSHKSVRGRIADLGLGDKAFEGKLHSFFNKWDVQEPENWTKPIALQQEWWTIAFDKWMFKEEQDLDSIQVSVLSVDLPCVQSGDQSQGGRLADLIGQQVLIPQNQRKMNAVFDVNPHPEKVRGLEHFTIQIVSQNGGPVGKSKKVKAWKTKKNQCSVSLLHLNKIDFEEGWHFVRALPWTADGDPIPLAFDQDDDATQKPYESELFYVLPGGASIEDEPPQRAIPIEKSLEHARLRLQMTALGDDRDPAEIQWTSVAWAEGNTARNASRQDILHVKFGREGMVQVPLSRVLKNMEQRILANPNHPSGWRMQINMNAVEPPSEIGLTLPSTTAMKSFLAARTEFFALVRQAGSELVIQGCSLMDASEKCVAYAQAFLDVIRSLMKLAETTSGSERQTHLQGLRTVLSVDSIHVILTDFRGRNREAVLIAPTHPLRSLWLSSWVNLGKKWIAKVQSGGRDHLPSIRTALLDSLQPSSFPMGVPVEDGRIFTHVENLTALWGVYAPTTENNIRGLISDMCVALGLPEPETAGSDISGNVLADKFARYLAQHPYVRELSLNIFNPGSGAVVANALTALQQKQEYSDLRYDVRLFSPDPTSPLLGESFDLLVRPGNTVNEAVDAFAAPSGSHLFTKLKLARYAMAEFNKSPEHHVAHISVLLDVFPAAELSTSESALEIVHLFGLIQDFETVFVDDDTGTYWHKRPVIGQVGDSPENDEIFDVLAKLNSNVCMATASVAASGASFHAVPVVTLGLNVEQRELIYEVHQASDWVFTIDRHMGIEFYDHGGLKDRPDYLIDFIVGSSTLSTRNLIISSRSTDELVAMIMPVLERYGLSVSSKQATKILAYLRSLSGQLALKLISSSSQQTEALGLALARLYLEYQGALRNQIILPLDAHTDLYKAAGKTDGVDDAISLQRTDLALFDMDLTNRTVTCNLVEVKCYSQVGDLTAFNQLKERISGQISQSERVLQRHFDPGLKKPDRPDRLLKSREFAKTLQFYLGRSMRYELMDLDAAKEAQLFLQSIEQGYSLRFRRCAIIFDFDKTGTDFPEMEVGIEFHRVGRDLVQVLLDGCDTISRSEGEVDRIVTHSLSEIHLPKIPKLDSAAFLALRRERTGAWMVTEEDRQGNPTDVVAIELVETLPGHQENLSGEVPKSSILSQESESGTSRVAPEQQLPCISDQEETGSLLIPKKGGGTVGPSDSSSNIPEDASPVAYDVVLGVTGPSPQYGLLGEVAGRKIALDLNHTHTISLFGVQGGGKSYTLGTVIEMASMAADRLNVLPRPLATVIFHYSPTQDYAPEFTSMVHPNSVEEEVRVLRERYQATPQALRDVVILTPSNKVSERQAEYPDLEVYPIAFAATELKASHWKFLMGAIGSQSMYMRQINLIMRGLRSSLTLESIRNGIDNSGLSDHLKDLAHTRLQFAGEYVSDGKRLQDLIKPGRLIVVDLRDEYIEKDEALGLFVVMLQIFSEATFNGQAFNKLVVFDEAHKYIENDDLVTGLVEVVREMRHKGTSIMVASQDPPSVPIALIELSSQIIMHKFNSPAWLKHIQKANSALGELNSEKMSRLGTGEAYVWSSKASDDSFSKGAVKIKCRPRVTQHGGGTKTAVS